MGSFTFIGIQRGQPRVDYKYQYGAIHSCTNLYVGLLAFK